MKKTRDPYSGIIQNVKQKDLFGSTLLCLLMSIAFDGVENNDKIDVLRHVLVIGRKRNYNVQGAIDLCLETLEHRGEEFMSIVKSALSLAKDEQKKSIDSSI